MIWEIFGWIAAALNIAGNLMLTRRGASGWIIRLGVNVLWLPYGIKTAAWALLANHLLFVAINAYGWWCWNREAKRMHTPGETPPVDALQEARRIAYQLGFEAGRRARD